MGFTVGLLTGATLTTLTTYLTIAYHRQQRATQALTLRQCSILLNGTVDPQPPRPPPSPREAKVGLTEIAKDMWNSRVQQLVQVANDTDWSAVREQFERGTVVVYGRVRDAMNGAAEKAEEKTK